MTENVILIGYDESSCEIISEAFGNECHFQSMPTLSQAVVDQAADPHVVVLTHPRLGMPALAGRSINI